MTNIQCDYCGQPFNKKLKEIKRSKHNFCSPVCYHKWSSETLRGEKKNSWKGGGFKTNCHWCGEDTFISQSKILRNHHYFCSKLCYSKWWANINHGDKSPRWCGGKIKKICLVCGCSFLRYPSQKGDYCSFKCSRKVRKIPQHNTKPESIFMDICNKYNLPFRYVGDSSLWIGQSEKLNPDFIECNGKKIIIEIFGDYWHSPLLKRTVREQETLNYRKQHYKRYRWRSIFIWESDLLREDAEQFVLNKLIEEKAICPQQRAPGKD